MNLNSAVFDNVLAIDERLRQLELEVSSMDKLYAEAPHPQIRPHIPQPPLERYQNLPQVAFDAKELPQPARKEPK